MLVLERQEGETLNIGPDITIKIMHVKFGRVPKVWIGITAPDHIAITRPDAKVLHPVTRRVRSLRSRA
jgi:carbon storage regulator CsrA